VMGTEEMIALFSLERINKKSAVFDPEKLEWMNGQYLAAMPTAELLGLVAPELIEVGLTSVEELTDRRAWFLALLELLKIRSRRVGDVVPQARVFLSSTLEFDQAAVDKHWKEPAALMERLRAVNAALQAVEPWEPAGVEGALRAAAERLGVGFGKLVHPLRVALTGGSASPGIDQVITLLGKTEVERRIRGAVERLQAPREHEQLR
jgi:nondiscriminating glutamyl-tRNA synthetase